MEFKMHYKVSPDALVYFLREHIISVQRTTNLKKNLKILQTLRRVLLVNELEEIL